MDFNEWRAEYPNGTRILWHDKLIKKEWLLGTITGTRDWNGKMVLLFRLDSDPQRERLPHMLSIENRELLKKFEPKHTELDNEDVRKLWQSGEAMMREPIKRPEDAQ